MHTTHARDGKRTQGGGVEDVLTAEDGGENLYPHDFGLFVCHQAACVFHSYSHSGYYSSPFLFLFLMRGDDPVTLAYYLGLNQLFLFFIVLLTSRCFVLTCAEWLHTILCNYVPPPPLSIAYYPC
jgi:hypothetical protein